jgi:hypothetical protein
LNKEEDNYSKVQVKLKSYKIQTSNHTPLHKEGTTFD